MTPNQIQSRGRRRSNASAAIRGGFLGGAFDPLRAADPKPELVRGDNRRRCPAIPDLHGQCLPPCSLRMVSFLQLPPPLLQVDAPITRWFPIPHIHSSPFFFFV